MMVEVVHSRLDWGYVLVEDGGCGFLPAVWGFKTKAEALKAGELAARHWDKPDED